MSEWNPEKYLLFKKQRTQPSIDLAQRLRNLTPNSIVDIGCGPGNSTAVLRNTFPNAKILGIDSSESMIQTARKSYAHDSKMKFEVCDAQNLSGTYDLLFSNACLQWIQNHRELLPMLMSKLNKGGTLAVQIPNSQSEPMFQMIHQVAQNSVWDFSGVHFEQNDILTPSEYYEVLSVCAAEVEIWETAYYHIMPSHGALLDWVRSTRLRPYLDVLSEAEKVDFEQEILVEVQKAYPLTLNGQVIFRFNRLFFIAKKE